MKKLPKIFIITTGVILAIVLLLIAYTALFTKVTPWFEKPISEIVPKDIPGWTSKELPLAETESMQKHVNKVLQFDQYVYRIYEKKDTHVTVYVAYWRPGKITTSDAGTHNPDSCWVYAGWERKERKYGMELALAGRELNPFEYGVYSKEGSALPVIFWHLVGGKVNRYADQQEGWRNGLAGRLERIPLFLADLRKYGLNQRREQMFIRITADKPFSDLFQDSDFIKLLSSLEPLGIFKDKSWGNIDELESVKD